MSSYQRDTDSGDSAEPDAAFPEIDGFVVEDVIGRGGMAVVYRARTTQFHRPVAIKVLRRGPEGKGRDHRRWNREARTLSLIPFHPNVVQFYSADCQNDLRFLVLELVEGGTLKDRLDRPIKPGEAAGLLSQLAGAVGHLHQAGVLHLDIKPSNILLQGPSRGDWTEVVPRLTDFGISKLEAAEAGESLTTFAGPVGTPQYMAPEQVKGTGAEIGRSADIYALGATLYHLLTGRAPFPAATTLMMHAMVIEQPPVAPRSLIPSIPRDLETICLTCLQKRPEARYDSAQALADDLERWMGGFPILAKPVSPIRKAWAWCRRRPVIAGMLTAMTILVLGSAIGFYALWQLSAANYEEAAKSLDGMISHALDAFNVKEPPGPFTVFLETARARQLSLRRTKPDDNKGRRRLAYIDRMLGQAYYASGTPLKAMPYCYEAVELLDESRARDEVSDEIRAEQLESLCVLGELGVEFPEPRSSEAFLDWWSQKVETLASKFTNVKLLRNAHLTLSVTRRHMANQLNWLGKVGLARSLMERDVQTLLSLPAEISETPEFVMATLHSQSLLGEGWEVQKLREVVASAKREADSDVKLLNHCIDYIANATAIRFGLLPTLRPDPSPPLHQSNDTPEQWTERVLADVAMRCKTAELGKDAPQRVIAQLREPVSRKLTWQRKRDQLDDAERDADRCLALAHRNVDVYPTSYEARLLLSEAYVQKAKNASRKNSDQALVFMAKGLDSAREAVSLAPEDPDARRMLDARKSQHERYRSQK